MAPKRKKSRKSAPPADAIGSRAALPGPIMDPLADGEVRHVVTMVALQRGVVSQEVNNWVIGVSTNLEAVGISTIRDIVENGASLNVLLSRAQLPRLNRTTTIQEILHEVCLMIQWPGDEPDAEE